MNYPASIVWKVEIETCGKLDCYTYHPVAPRYSLNKEQSEDLIIIR